MEIEVIEERFGFIAREQGERTVWLELFLECLGAVEFLVRLLLLDREWNYLVRAPECRIVSRRARIDREPVSLKNAVGKRGVYFVIVDG